MKKICLLLVAIVALLLVNSCGKLNEEQPLKAEVGKNAPDFTLLDTKGSSWNLSDLRGQVVFVNFWATWCAPCRQEMPSMQELYSSLPEDKFKMLAILSNDEPALAVAVTEKLKCEFPILIDPDSKIAKNYGITGVPETFIIDKKGVLREWLIGPVHWTSPQAKQLIMKYF